MIKHVLLLYNYFLTLIIFFSGTAYAGVGHSKAITNITNSSKELILQIYQQAENGQILGSNPYGIGSSVEEVVENWENPDVLDDHQITYSYFHVMFLHKEGKVTQVVRVNEQVGQEEYTELTMNEIKKYLGKPAHSKTKKEITLLHYQTNSNYHLLLGFTKDQKLHYYQVIDDSYQWKE